MAAYILSGISQESLGEFLLEPV
jgi:hypothetical protein